MPSRIIRELKSGRTRLTIWEHQDEKGTRKSITIARLYKSGGRWQSTQGLAPEDLLDAVAVCLEANKFLRLEDRWSGLSKKEGLIRKSPFKKP